jgi:chromodomain-helicase-DNA-binding protein 7
MKGHAKLQNAAPAKRTKAAAKAPPKAADGRRKSTAQDVAAEEAMDRKATEYLVKWSRIGYAGSTWEIGTAIKDDEAITNYQHRRDKWGRKPGTATERKKVECRGRFQKSSPEALQEYLQYIVATEKQLRDYQVEGVNWLRFCSYHTRGCILGDEMGLGKTCQTAVFLEQTKRSMKGCPIFLVVVPLSTLGNWQRELREWTTLDFVTFHGTADDRKLIKAQEFDKGLVPRFDLMLTTIQMILPESSFFSKISFDTVVVDEGHSLKNSQSQGFDHMRALQAGHRVLLTGTPVQNNAGELFALLNMVGSARCRLHLPKAHCPMH